MIKTLRCAAIWFGVAVRKSEAQLKTTISTCLRNDRSNYNQKDEKNYELRKQYLSKILCVFCVFSLGRDFFDLYWTPPTEGDQEFKKNYF